MQLAAGEVEYLGYRIRPGISVSPGEAKCRDIQNWRLPDSVKRVRQFIGLCSFFRRTIPSFAQIAAPLHRLIKKDSGYEDGQRMPDDARHAFETLQKALCARPCLKPVDFDKDFILTTDASKTVLGAVLSQKHGEIEHPVAYASRVLSDQEKKMAPFHLEYAAMMFGCKHFRPYLLGKSFLLRTDHKPLVTINKNQSDALGRLQAQLMEYLPFEIQYLKGEKMPADGLSRLEEILAVHSEQPMQQVMPIREARWTSIRQAQRQDRLCKAIVLNTQVREPPR